MQSTVATDSHDGTVLLQTLYGLAISLQTVGTRKAPVIRSGRTASVSDCHVSAVVRAATMQKLVAKQKSNKQKNRRKKRRERKKKYEEEEERNEEKK